MSIPDRKFHKLQSTYTNNSFDIWELQSKHLKMYSCNKCNKNFKNRSKLMEHKTRRTCRPPTHHCERCNKGFASYQTLWKHKQCAVT